MPELSRFFGIAIRLHYADDYLGPETVPAGPIYVIETGYTRRAGGRGPRYEPNSSGGSGLKRAS